MGLEKLSFRSLADLDHGRGREAFDQLLHRCYSDCRDRPGVKAVRTVTFTLEVSPVLSEDLELAEVEARVKLNCSLPKTKSRPYSMKVAPAGMFFNPDALHDANQLTMDMVAGPESLEGEEPEEDAADVG